MQRLVDYINTVFGIENETSATIVITLIVFILGFLITGIVGAIRRFSQRKVTRNLFISLVEEILKSATRQSKNFHEFTTTLNIENQDSYSLGRYPLNHLDNINNLPFSDFHNAYFNGLENIFCKRKRAKAFNMIWKYLSTLKYFESRYPDELVSFINKFNVYENKRNEEIEKWRQILDNLLFETNNKQLPPRLKEYMESLDEIVFNWQNNSKNTHYHIVQLELVKPLRKLNKDYKDIPYTLHFNTPLLGITQYYNNMVSVLLVYSKIFKSYYYTYRSASKLLSASLNSLRS